MKKRRFLVKPVTVIIIRTRFKLSTPKRSRFLFSIYKKTGNEPFCTARTKPLTITCYIIYIYPQLAFKVTFSANFPDE